MATAQEYTKRILHRGTQQQRHQRLSKGCHNIGDQGSENVLILGPLQTERNPEPLTFSETRPDKHF